MTDSTVQESTSAPQVQLKLEDLVLVLESMQLAASRGAYKPEEFTAIGQCYERIFAFLEAAGAVKKPAAPPITEGNQS